MNRWRLCVCSELLNLAFDLFGRRNGLVSVFEVKGEANHWFVKSWNRFDKWMCALEIDLGIAPMALLLPGTRKSWAKTFDEPPKL